MYYWSRLYPGRPHGDLGGADYVEARLVCTLQGPNRHLAVSMKRGSLYGVDEKTVRSVYLKEGGIWQDALHTVGWYTVVCGKGSAFWCLRK